MKNDTTSINNQIEIFDTIVIGSGPAGTGAVVYAGNAGLKTLLIGGSQIPTELNSSYPGGLINQTSHVPNYLGLPNISGGDFCDTIIKHAKLFAPIKYNNVLKINKKDKKFFILLDNNEELQSKSIIICTGSNPKKLGILGENNSKVSSCAICDGFLYKDKIVAVVGGGNSALEEVIYLSNIASKVFLIHRRKEFTAFQPLQDQVYSLPNVTLILNQVVNTIEESEKKLILNLKNEQLIVDGLFIAIGYKPNTSIFPGEKNEMNEILVDNSMETSIKGIFAAGDVICYRDNRLRYKQAIVSSAEGCVAALEAHKYVTQQEN